MSNLRDEMAGRLLNFNDFNAFFGHLLPHNNLLAEVSNSKQNKKTNTMKHQFSIPADSEFRKSTHSGDGSGSGDGCVSVAMTQEGVFIRDTKDTSKTTLIFDHNEWKAFLGGVRSGEFAL